MHVGIYFTECVHLLGCAYIKKQKQHNLYIPKRDHKTTWHKVNKVSYLPSHWLALLVGLYCSCTLFTYFWPFVNRVVLNWNEKAVESEISFRYFNNTLKMRIVLRCFHPYVNMDTRMPLNANKRHINRHPHCVHMLAVLLNRIYSCFLRQSTVVLLWK